MQEMVMYICYVKNQFNNMEEKHMATITKDMIIAEVLNEHQDTVPIFMNSGLHCLGCAMAHGETIEEACMVHGLDCDALVDALNNYLENA